MRRLQSMTGFGRASVDPEFGRLRIEARSVNGRHLDVRVTLPRADGELEIRLVRRVRERLERGRVDVTVVEEGGAAGPNVRVNAEAAAAVHRALDELRQRLGLPGSVTLDLVAAQRGVIEAVEAGDPDRTRAAIVRGVDAALDMLEDGRVEEGRALVADLRVQIDLLGAALERLRGLAAAAPEAVRARLRSRLADLLGPESAIDPQRLAAEVTLLAARADIHEEIARARSHVDRVAALLDGGGPVGRKLDFLCQEMGREVNTMGAKLDDGAAIDEVLAMKTAVERIREQAQNLE